MCMKDFDECDCECHDLGGAMSHIVACCGACPHCEKNIAFWALESHTENCHLNPARLSANHSKKSKKEG